MSRDTTLLLFVFTALTAFGGFFTYVNVLERYNAKLAEIQNEHEKQTRKYEYSHNKLLELEIDLRYEIARSTSNSALDILRKDGTKIKEYLSLSLCAIEKYSELYKMLDDVFFKENILKTINISIEFNHDIIKNQVEIFELVGIELEVYKNRIKTISDVLDVEKLHLFNTTISKIKLVE
jgi:hypothetical protein